MPPQPHLEIIQALLMAADARRQEGRAFVNPNRMGYIYIYMHVYI
jgi:hypothetical protein